MQTKIILTKGSNSLWLLTGDPRVDKFLFEFLNNLLDALTIPTRSILFRHWYKSNCSKKNMFLNGMNTHILYIYICKQQHHRKYGFLQQRFGPSQKVTGKWQVYVIMLHDENHKSIAQYRCCREIQLYLQLHR